MEEDEFDEYESLEAEASEEPVKKQAPARQPQGGQAQRPNAQPKPAQAPAAPQQQPPKWVPFHQVERIGLVNTETEEVIDGFKDEGSAAAMAKVLNELDTIIVAGGYQ